MGKVYERQLRRELFDARERLEQLDGEVVHLRITNAGLHETFKTVATLNGEYRELLKEVLPFLGYEVLARVIYRKIKDAIGEKENKVEVQKEAG